jgi:lysophospholipase L1-like esterase
MRITFIVGILGTLVAVLAAVAIGFAATGPDKSGQESIRFLALGDSYTIGESVAETGRWPMQLRDSLLAHGEEVAWYKIIARTGWKTRELQSAIDQIQPDHDYNLVSLLIGVNDYFQGRGIDEYKTRFQALLETAVAHAGGHKSRVFVVSIPDYSYTPQYKQHMDIVSKGIDSFNAINKKITLAAGIQYFDITPLSRLGLKHPDWVAYDGLHPSAVQYTAWVKLMLP